MLCAECGANLQFQPAHWKTCSQHDPELLDRLIKRNGEAWGVFVEAMMNAVLDRSREQSKTLLKVEGMHPLSPGEQTALDVGILFALNTTLVMLFEQGLIDQEAVMAFKNNEEDGAA